MTITAAYDTGTDKLLLTVDDGIATVTFNNPEKRNALSLEIRTALPGLLGHLQANPDIRVVVITGAGDKAFVSGGDISEFGAQRTTAEARAEFDRQGAVSAQAWAALEKPIIAKIRGFCLGGGLLTAMQADIRIAADDSTFGIPAARLGLGYGYAGVKRLMNLVGEARAAEILFTARRFDAAEAMRMGLVNRVVPVDQLDAEVDDLARTITDNAPMTVAACKAAIREAVKDPDQRDLQRVAAMVEACFQSEDYKEGQRAFMDKRRPRFSGR